MIIHASEQNKVLLHWKNKKNVFDVLIDPDIAGCCSPIALAKKDSEKTGGKMLIDVSSSENAVWDKKTIENSFNFLKDPLKTTILSIDQLRRMQDCIDYLSPDKSCMEKVRTTILEGLGVNEAKAELVLNKLNSTHTKYLIQFVQDLNDKKTEIEMRRDHSKKILISHYQNSVLEKDEFKILTDLPCTNYRTLAFRFTAKGHFLNLSFLYENINKIISANAKELDISSERAVKISRLFFGSGFPIIVIGRMPESKKTEYNFTQAEDTRYVDASGLKGDEEAKFIFSKNLPSEVKSQITQEIDLSNKKMRMYRAFLNYNPLSMVSYASRKMIKKIINKGSGWGLGNMLLGSFVIGAIGTGLILYYYVVKKDCASRTVEALQKLNESIHTVKDELLEKEKLLCGLANTIAEPMRNEFKKYISLSQWKEILSSLQSEGFSSNVIELLKNNHFNQLIPIDPTTKNVIIKPGIIDLGFIGFESICGGIATTIASSLSFVCLYEFGKFAKQHIYMKKNEVKFE